jgi:hypothetical protein
MLAEQEIIERLIKGSDFLPLKWVETIESPDILSSNLPVKFRPDLLLKFQWQGKERLFITEVKRQATPRVLEGAINQVQLYIQKLKDAKSEETYYPLIIVPFLSEGNLDQLIAKNVSGIDLSGNGVVIVPNEWFIYRTGAKNLYPSSVPIKNVFRGTSSLVARIFLIHPNFKSVNEVYEEIRNHSGEITLPTVSKALKALQEELLVGRTEGIKLLDAKRLLEMLEKNYRRPFLRRRMRGRFTDKQAALVQIVSNAKEKNIPLAAEDPTRYTVIPGGEQLMKIYTTSIETVLRGVEFTETSRFPEIELYETDEPSVYFDRRWESGFYWTSPIEVYLELSAGGKREYETAVQMKDDIQEFKYYL